MSDEIYLEELESLDYFGKKEILKKANINDRKRSLAGDLLIKKYLSKIYGMPKEKIEIKKGKHGKPYVLNIPAHFNISHSGNYTVVAISDSPIGIDLEIIEDFSAILAKKLFNEDELKYISEVGSMKRKNLMQQCFYEIWTAKEAYLKFIGCGISGGVNSLSFTLCDNKLIPNKNDITLEYDYSIPGAIVAVVTAKK
jgi:4'-phosphopantetheinyl transferase